MEENKKLVKGWRQTGEQEEGTRAKQTRNQEGARSRKILVGRDPEDSQDRGPRWSQGREEPCWKCTCRHRRDERDGAKGSGDPGGAAEPERPSSAEDAVDRGGAAVTSSRGWVPED